MGGDKVKMVVTETIIINHLLENRRTDLLEVGEPDPPGFAIKKQPK